MAGAAVRDGQAGDRFRLRHRRHRLGPAHRPAARPVQHPQRPLDVGYSAGIPEPIRRTVILRDRHCAWPGGCGKPPAACGVHHVRHKKDGGPTSVSGCLLLCQYHHDICIHRWGWEIELLPGGEVIARSPQGQVIRSHSPPPAQAAA